MAEPRTFPYTLSYGSLGMFRVVHANVGVYRIEQKVTQAAAETGWQCLAISNHFDAGEALEAMHEAQMSYAIEVRARQEAVKKGALNAKA